MSNGSQEIERVRQARNALERMRRQLLCPAIEALDSSASDLKLAVDCLRKIDISAKSPVWRWPVRQKIEPEVVALRRTVASVEDLLRNAAKFYAGLSRLMAPDEAAVNYTAAGTNGPSACFAKSSVVLHG